MRLTSLQHETDVAEFVKEAAAAFEKNPSLCTYTRSHIESGCLFAVKWGLGDDCILVLTLHDYNEPVVYSGCINKEPNDDQ